MAAANLPAPPALPLAAPLDWAALREREFPVCRQLAYLNHAAVSPLTARAAAAMEQAVALVREVGAARYGELVERTERTRLLGARLLGCDPAELALVTSTSHGLSLVAFGLDWQPGDNLVTSALEFPANVYPWWCQRERGVEVRTAPAPRGWVGPADIEPLIDQRTRVVALSSVQYSTGGVTELAPIAELAHAHGAWLVVDGIQSVGVLPMDVRALGVDALAADGHKWLLGPEGLGLFYCAPPLRDRLRLTAAGWHSVRDFLAFDRLALELQPDARRFEPGSVDRVAAAGLGASLELLLELGIPRIAGRVGELTARLRRGLAERELPLLSPPPPAAGSGIVTFAVRGEEPEAAVARLLQAGVFVSARGAGLRASPHAYNTEREIDQLLEGLRG